MSNVWAWSSKHLHLGCSSHAAHRWARRSRPPSACVRKPHSGMKNMGTYSVPGGPAGVASRSTSPVSIYPVASACLPSNCNANHPRPRPMSTDDFAYEALPLLNQPIFAEAVRLCSFPPGHLLSTPRWRTTAIWMWANHFEPKTPRWNMLCSLRLPTFFQILKASSP